MKFSSNISKECLSELQKGVMTYQYKGGVCNKSPFYLATYHRLLWALKPKTIIEIGYKEGGSALWFSDITKAMKLNTKIVAVDHVIPDQSVTFEVELLKGDVNKLEKRLTDAVLKRLPKLLLVVEDSSHTFQGCMSVLCFFADRLDAGDYLVIEDGILSDLGMDEKCQGGLNWAIATFFEEYPGVYRVDRNCCDMFGENVTYITRMVT